MREAFMKSNNDQDRGSVEDKRRRSDRRSDFDRRQNDNGQRLAGEDANGQEDIFTTKEACEYLKVSRPTYMKCIASGKIKARKVGRGWRAFQSELNRFLCSEWLALTEVEGNLKKLFTPFLSFSKTPPGTRSGRGLQSRKTATEQPWPSFAFPWRCRPEILEDSDPFNAFRW